MIAHIDSLGRRTESRFDAANRLTEVRYGDGTSEQFAYDAAGRRTAATDRSGHTTKTLYDALGRIVVTILPDSTPDDDSDNPRTRVEYDAASQVTATIDVLGRRVEYEYDAAGRRIAVRDTLGRVSRVNYDAAGRVIAHTDPAGNVTRYSHDAIGRLIETILPGGQRLSQSYDISGALASATDAAGNVTHFEYDQHGRLSDVVNALGQRTSYERDGLGRVISQTDAKGNITRFEYDGAGRRTSITLPSGAKSTGTYDNVGNPTSVTDFNGATTTFTYDDGNRPLTKRFSDGTTTAYTYAATGQLATVTDGRGTTMYRYDSRGQLESRTDPDGRSISYTYDAAGNMTSITVPSGTTTYAYDSVGRLITVTDSSQGVTSYQYDVLDNVTRTDLPDGTFQTATYDANNTLVLLRDESSAGLLASYEYVLDALGQPRSIQEGNGRRTEYSYDVLGRLVREAITDPTDGDRIMEYTYDAVGNRLARADSVIGTTSYSYNNNDQLVEEASGGVVTRYTYDKNGNMLSRSTTSTEQSTYQWGPGNRLVRADVTAPTGTVTVRYVYDAAGNRVAQDVDGAVTYFLVDTNRPIAQVVEEYDSNAIVQTAYAYGNTLLSAASAEQRQYYHLDGHGDTRFLTHAAGAPTARYAYDSFGRILREPGAANDKRLYTGEHFDPTLKQYYLRARYYDPHTGRFTSSDSWPGQPTDPLSLNRYAYARMNPVTHFDPSGLQTVTQTITAISIGSILSAGALGGTIGGVDAYLSGGNVGYGVLLGTGAGAGGVLAFSVLAVYFPATIPVLGAGGTILGGIGVYEAAKSGNRSLAMFRVFTSMASLRTLYKVAGDITGPPQTVYHTTSPAAKEAILGGEVHKVGGKWGIFSLESEGAPSNAPLLGIGPNLRNVRSLVPGDLSAEIAITGDATKAFGAPDVTGAFGVARHVFGVRSTKLGSIDLASGKFIPNEIMSAPGQFRQASSAEIGKYYVHQLWLDVLTDALLWQVPNLVGASQSTLPDDAAFIYQKLGGT